MFLFTMVLGSLAMAGQENAGIGGPNKKNMYQPSEIYSALNVQAANVNPGMAGLRRQEKSVGGLTCVREQSAAVTLKSRIQHSCSIDHEQVDFGAIYNALNVEEQKSNQPKVGGSWLVQKSVGGLTCFKSTRSAILKVSVSYNCKFIGE